MRVRIYQIDTEKDTNRVKFMDYDYLKQHGGLNPAVYRCVYAGPINADSIEDVFRVLNQDECPGTYQGHSLSVSDIVEDMDTGKCLFCDSFGWRDVDFDTSQCAEMEGLRVLMIQPHEAPVETHVVDDLSHWQRAVSEHSEDSLMEVTYPFEDGTLVISNEESKLIGMEGNRHINGAVYAGPLFIAGDTGYGEFRGLTDDEVQRYSEKFAQPEEISQDEVEADTGFMIWGLG